MNSASDVRQRIFTVARAHFFERGYSGLNMDDLATELGMSKKTLYVQFPSKSSLVEAIVVEFVNEVRTDAEALLSDPKFHLTVKLHRFCEAIANHFSQTNMCVFRDLQRHAPFIYCYIDELQHRDIPLILGRRLRQGQVDGIVRPYLDFEFAIVFWCNSIQVLMHPDNLERLKIDSDYALSKAITILLGGLLSPAHCR